MFTVGNRLLGLLLLILVAAMPAACVNVDRDSSRATPRRDVSVGGEYGVNVDRSGSGTDVKIGGDHGVVVEHPRNPPEEDRR
ncbi:MAG: hypothetical protein PHU85_09920 [Phycisphaerae bacterium]|nr:hypothetical protein [Phycisphaerae bacterium]